MHHAHRGAHALPVEEVLVFGRGEVEQHAVVGRHALEEYVGELVFPEELHRPAARLREADAVFHAVGHDGVEGAEQAVEEARDPEVLLGKAKGPVGERGRPEVLVGLPVVGEQGGEGRGGVELLEPLPVFRRQLAAAVELCGQFVHVELGHRGRQPVGHGLEARHAGRSPFSPLLHDFGVGKKYLHSTFNV